MTLHKLTELIKKFGLGTVIGLGVIILLIVIFRIGLFVKDIVAPPQADPPNQAYGDIPPIEFPKSELNNNFTYTLNTISGTLPDDFPDRLNIYPIEKPAPSLLNLDKIKTKVETLGFTNIQGEVLPETTVNNIDYQWQENKGISRRIIFNIITFDFNLDSQFLSSLTVLGAQHLSNETDAIEKAEDFLSSIELLPEDIATETDKVRTELLAIENGILIPTTSLSTAQVIRVNFYQKDMEYDLDTGQKDETKIRKIKMPILYPKPPYSTMSFWVASGQFDQEVVKAEFAHQNINVPTEDPKATYPIKTASEAFEELKNGKSYIASYFGLEKNILINNVYLAYYLGAEKQDYLIPIIVFEGQDGFMAYVSATKGN